MDRKTLTVIFSVILLVGFFLPFFKFDSSSGFDIVFKSAGGGGNNEWEKYLWLLIPVPSLLLLIGALNNEQYVFGRGFLGILPLLFLIYVAVRRYLNAKQPGGSVVIEDFIKIFAMGYWICLGASLFLALVYPRRK